MHSDDVVRFLTQHLALPPRLMFSRDKAFMGTPLIELFHRWPGGVELISHNQAPTGGNVPSTVLHCEGAFSFVDEADHVSGDNDQVELTAEIHRWPTTCYTSWGSNKTGNWRGSKRTGP